MNGQKTMSTQRGKRRRIQGTVVSDKMTKTIRVQVVRLVKHPRYSKFVRRKATFVAHDEKGEAKLGDRVEIIESRPLSATKRWRLVKVLERAR